MNHGNERANVVARAAIGMKNHETSEATKRRLPLYRGVRESCQVHHSTDSCPSQLRALEGDVRTPMF